MGNKTKVSVIGLEGTDMAMRVSNNDHRRYCHHNFVLFIWIRATYYCLPMKLGEANVFKVSVCPQREVRYLWSHVPSGGYSIPTHSPGYTTPYPPEPHKRAVRILLECFLVYYCYCSDICNLQLRFALHTSFRQKCLKLRCHDFSALADWSPKQTMSYTLHAW